MSPELRARITARNETAAGFAEVKRDALATANAIEASGARAATGLMRQNSALMAVAGSSRMAAAQQRNLVFQLNDIGVSLASGMNPLMVIAQQGSQIATIYGPEEGGVGKALKETGNLALGLVTKFAPVLAVIGAGATALAGLQYEINKTSDVQVSFGDTALAVWQTVSEGIYNWMKPALDWLGDTLSSFWETIQPGLKAAGNGIIATFLGIFDAVSTAWNALTNNVLAGLDMLATGATSRKVLGVGEIGADVAGAFTGAFSNDYLGSLFAGVSANARKNALARLAEETDRAGKSAGKAVSEYAAWADDGIGKMIEKAEKLADTLSGALTDGVMSIWQAFRSGENVLEAVSNKLMSFADQLLEAGIQSFFRSIIGGGFGTGGWNIPTSFVPGGFFPGFATGGDFTVGGSGGTDSQLVAFRATPGEEVSIRRPGQSGGAGIVNNFYIDAKGAEIGVEQKIAYAIKTAVPGMIRDQAPAAVARSQLNRNF